MSFGKGQSRLHGVRSLTLDLTPSAKIVDAVKAHRSEVCPATFKTTADLPLEVMRVQATENMIRSGSDFVLQTTFTTTRIWS